MPDDVEQPRTQSHSESKERTWFDSNGHARLKSVFP